MSVIVRNVRERRKSEGSGEGQREWREGGKGGGVKKIVV